MGILKEFREFALKGNVVDLAVGVIIGGAFGTIVGSMVADLIMPVVGLAGNVNFKDFYLPLSQAVKDEIAVRAATTTPSILPLEEAKRLGSVLAYGNFITVTINFIILAFCIFIVVKLMNNARKLMEREAAAAPPPPPPGPTKEEMLLGEIRDILKARG